MQRVADESLWLSTVAPMIVRDLSSDSLGLAQKLGRRSLNSNRAAVNNYNREILQLLPSLHQE
jgi:hypothetical protein